MLAKYLPQLVLPTPLPVGHLCWFRRGEHQSNTGHVSRGWVMRDVAARHVAHVEVRQLMLYSLAFTSTATPAASTAPPQHSSHSTASRYLQLYEQN